MQRKYSQAKAILSLSKASLLATIRSPTSMVFALLFPLIFVTVFGAMVDNTAVKLNIALSPHSDTTSVACKAVRKISIFDISFSPDSAAIVSALEKGRISAILYIPPAPASGGLPQYDIALLTSSASEAKLPLIRAALQEVVGEINRQAQPAQPVIAQLTSITIPGRIYRQIDFILPGQLGFSLLMAGVFGSAFLLFNLRQTLVIKRIRVTPITTLSFLSGEMISRLLFQIICFIIITALGYYAFHFTLVNGMLTFLEMLFLSIFGLVIFTSIGFMISGLVQNESSIAPVANTVTVPQILLCGLFFPIENYPAWLRHFCEWLPLTFFVDGLRKIAFEGAHIWQIPYQIGGLIIWAVIFVALAVYNFKWE